MHFDSPALKPLYKIDGLKIRGAGTRPEERVERTQRSWTNVMKQKFARMKKKFVFGGLKSFLENLLFFVEVCFRQLSSDSCLYMLEFSRV